MLNFQILFFLLKKSLDVCTSKRKKNEIYYLSYVLHDVETSAGDSYCIILNF